MTRRRSGQRGQASISLVAGAMLAMLGVVLLAQFGAALAARGSDQRAADLAAAAAARRMAGDYPRLFEPPLLPGGAINPSHISLQRFRQRAQKAALAAARVNKAAAHLRRVELAHGPAPTSVTVESSHLRELKIAGTNRRRSVHIRARATAQLTFSFAAMPGPTPVRGSGGGYNGPLAYRQGKPLRPDVALAFDRMAAAARRAGHLLTVNSGFRSDAEQARLFAAHPDPKWVAPPGTSLHRYGTEIDIGPPSAYAWLAANARRFGFIKRYAWNACPISQGRRRQRLRAI